MLFNSFTFWIFFGLVAAVYRCLAHRWRNRFLIFASYLFYGFWDWRFLGLILISTLVDFLAGRGIAASNGLSRRRGWLLLSLGVNLGMLGVFKYLGFFVAEFNALLSALGARGEIPGIDLILPVGISFYTFQTLSYTLDVYRGVTRPAEDFADFALYVAFFPQLVAGPIERSHHLLPQVQQERPGCDAIRFREGLYLVLTGLFLKVVIADNLAWLANHVFSRPTSELAGPEVLLGVYAFAFQIYGDFAGYSAIAIGIAKWLGFDLMENFRRPYFAVNPRDFWRRWHISLSTWLRDYLYISLGGNRHGAARTARNLMMTMVLGGLWHGAAWTFVIWGALHGGWLVFHRLASKGRPKASGFGQILAIVGTFHFVCLGWLFFRAETFEHAIGMLGAIGGDWAITDFAATASCLLVFFVGPWLLFELWQERRGDNLAILRQHWGWRAALYLYIVLMLILFPPPEAAEFIYFQF